MGENWIGLANNDLTLYTRLPHHLFNPFLASRNLLSTIRVGSHVVFAWIHCTDVRIHCTDILIECR